MRCDDDGGRHLFLVLGEKGFLGHDKSDPGPVHICQGFDMLLKAYADCPPQVHVPLKVGGGPPVHLENIPGGSILRNKILTHKKSNHPLGIALALEIDHAVGNFVGNSLLIQPERYGVEQCRV